MKTNILILSTNRADFSHLYLTIKEMKKSQKMNAVFAACGGHFDKKRGGTLDELYELGMKPDYKIREIVDWRSEAKLFSSLVSFEKKLRTLIKMVEADYVMVLGDRIELLAVVNLALIMNKKIIHISGGEKTEGAVDDYIRMLLSTVSYIHFVSGEYFKKNLSAVLQKSAHIYNTGDPVLEYIEKSENMDLDKIAETIGMKLEKGKYILFTFHPETKDNREINEQFKGIEQFLSESRIPVICTAPNADMGGNHIIKRLKHIASVNENVNITMHLGFKRYIGLIKNALCVMGNSSSLLIEAPYLNVPSLLLGDRQKGRPLSESIVNTGLAYEDIVDGFNRIEKMLKEGGVKNKAICYERKETSVIIREKLEELLC